MTSVAAFDACLIVGAMVQCALILRARRFPPPGWILSLGALLLGPLVAYGFFRMMTGHEDSAGLALMGFVFGTTVAGVYLMDAPPRVSAIGLLSLTVTFWAACWPQGARPDWFFPAVAASALTFLCAVVSWTPPAFMRLGLYIWYLCAAAGAAAATIPFKALFGSADPLASMTPVEALLIGAQSLLFLHALSGLILLLSFDDRRDPLGEQEARWKRYTRNLVAGSGPGTRPGWLAFGAVVVQAALLIAVRRTGLTMHTEILSLSALAALAHGAMSGEDAASDQRRTVIS